MSYDTQLVAHTARLVAEFQMAGGVVPVLTNHENLPSFVLRERFVANGHDVSVASLAALLLAYPQNSEDHEYTAEHAAAVLDEVADYESTDGSEDTAYWTLADLASTYAATSSHGVWIVVEAARLSA